MTTLACIATEHDGRVLPHMLYIHEDIRAEFEKFTKAMHEEGAMVSGQLSHCGGFTSNKKLLRKPPRGPSFGINKLGLSNGNPIHASMRQQDIDYFVKTFSHSAKYMKEVGFDAIELHMGHGYGLSQFISPKTNRRSDQYGGSLTNRMRVPLMVLGAIREQVGDDFPILVKISMEDGVNGGLQLDESIEVASILDKEGVDAIIPSSGTSSFNPMLMFRGQSIASQMIDNAPNILMKLGIKMLGRRMFKEYPYVDLYLREDALRIRERVDCVVCYIGGCSSADNIASLMSDGFDFVQLGRPLIFDPKLIAHLKENKNYSTCCDHCNFCAGLIEAEGGIYCNKSSIIS